jgi:hypothetical protein
MAIPVRPKCGSCGLELGTQCECNLWYCQNCGHEDTEEAFIPTASPVPHMCSECGSVDVFPKSQPGPITGIKLHRTAKHVFVSIEVNGQWLPLIREPICGQFHHIVEGSGIRSAIRRRDAFGIEEAYNDLRNSGGIVDAP